MEIGMEFGGNTTITIESDIQENQVFGRIKVRPDQGRANQSSEAKNDCISATACKSP